MIDMTSDCISPTELATYALGMLNPIRAEIVGAHLRSCLSCEETLSGLDDTSDSLVQWLQAQRSADASDKPADAEPEFDRAMNRIGGMFVKKPAAAQPLLERIRDYELIEPIGSGGMGTVYKAVHEKLGRTVAVKVLPARYLGDTEAIARFEREMRTIGQLDHPAIVRATDAGTVNGTSFLVMDLIDGIDLSRVVRACGRLDVADACELIRQAAFGLQHAHDSGLIHRDVKPSNLMLTKQGEVRILDLGLATSLVHEDSMELTTVGQLMGTLDYMAPEQGDNCQSIDARADIYSLGATLFKLLVGHAPFAGGENPGPLGRLRALATLSPPSVGSVRNDLPAELVTVVDRMLNRDPKARFGSAAEVAEAMTTFAEGHALSQLADTAMGSPDATVPARPFVAKAEPNAKPNAQPLAAATNRRTGWFGLIGWLLLPLVLLCGIMAWIQTDTGTLLVESASDDVPIEIYSGEEVVERATLKLGENSISIRSGSYRIKFGKQAGDALKIEKGVFELRRGGAWLARVTVKPGGSGAEVVETESGTAAAGATAVTQPEADADTPIVIDPRDQPVFSGKTLAEWQTYARRETNPNELRKVVDALGALQDSKHSGPVAQVLAELLSRPNARTADESAELFRAGLKHLRALPFADVEPHLVRMYSRGCPELRMAVLEDLAEVHPRAIVSEPAARNQRRLSAGRRSSEVPLQAIVFQTTDFAVTKPRSGFAKNVVQSTTFRQSVARQMSSITGNHRLGAIWILEQGVEGKNTPDEIIQAAESLLKVDVDLYDDALRGTVSSDANTKLYAARLLARSRPDTELGKLFLKRLTRKPQAEQPKGSYPNVNFRRRKTWWDIEFMAWLGLYELGPAAAPLAPQIAELLTRFHSAAPAETIALREHTAAYHEKPVVLGHQTLTLEILERIGRPAGPTSEKIIGVFTSLASSRNPGTSYEPVRTEPLLEMIPRRRLSKASSGEGLSSNTIDGMSDPVRRINRALMAYESVTGGPANIYSSSWSTFERYETAEERSKHLPRLHKYDGRTLEETIAAVDDVRGKSTEELIKTFGRISMFRWQPVRELDKPRRWVAMDREQGKLCADIAERTFRQVLTRPEPNWRAINLLSQCLETVHLHSSERAAKLAAASLRDPELRQVTLRVLVLDFASRQGQLSRSPASRSGFVGSYNNLFSEPVLGEAVAELLESGKPQDVESFNAVLRLYTLLTPESRKSADAALVKLLDIKDSRRRLEAVAHLARYGVGLPVETRNRIYEQLMDVIREVPSRDEGAVSPEEWLIAACVLPRVDRGLEKSWDELVKTVLSDSKQKGSQTSFRLRAALRPGSVLELPISRRIVIAQLLSGLPKGERQQSTIDKLKVVAGEKPDLFRRTFHYDVMARIADGSRFQSEMTVGNRESESTAFRVLLRATFKNLLPRKDYRLLEAEIGDVPLMK